jgi:threonine/homoserine efflux transporter RhtA
VSRRALLLFAVVGVLWGIPYFFIALAGREFSTPSIVWLRVVIGALFLLPLALKRGVLKDTIRNWPWVLFFAVVEMVGPWYFITEAERSVPSSLVGLMMTTIPFMSAFITGVFLGDKAAGHPLTVAAVGPVFGESAPGRHPVDGPFGHSEDLSGPLAGHPIGRVGHRENHLVSNHAQILTEAPPRTQG